MASILTMPDGHKLQVDRILWDDGKLPVMAIMGGQKTVFERGTPPKTRLYQRGQAFFTMDEQPARAEAIQPWLDDPDFSAAIKGELQKYLTQLAKGKPVKEKLSRIRPQKPEPKWTRHLTPEDMGLSSQQAERV